jgi:hypothetical protein
MVLHHAPIDHLAKLRRVVARLEKQEMHADDMDDFCKTAWHLIELVEKDPGSAKKMRREAIRLRADPDLILCEHVANAEKHRNVRAAVVEKSPLAGAEVRQGWGIGRYGQGAFGVGEQSIKFKLKNGTEYDAFDFAAAVLRKWEAVFSCQ